MGLKLGLHRDFHALTSGYSLLDTPNTAAVYTKGNIARGGGILFVSARSLNHEYSSIYWVQCIQVFLDNAMG